jgi:hypothetical protein
MLLKKALANVNQLLGGSLTWNAHGCRISVNLFPKL